MVLALPESAPFLGASPRQNGRAGVLLAVACAAVMVLVLVAGGGGRSASLFMTGGQMLVVGEAYPYVRTPYSDSYRPYGYQTPAQYPVYPYESGYSYSNVEPYYSDYHKDAGKQSHEWFPDNYNVGTGPMTPLWTAMGMKQAEARQAALRQQGTGLDRAMRTSLLNQQDYSPTTNVGGGQYYSPILPTETETPTWNLFGDGWQDHTYEPSVNLKERREDAGQGSQALHSQLRAGVRSEARLGDDRGFQQLAHAEWHTRGHSNNYMGMHAPVGNIDALGDHQVGFHDTEYNATGVGAEEQNHVVDNALRSAWDMFAGNDDVTAFEMPKMGFSLDNHIRCEEENDPSLCSPRPDRLVSEEHTNPNWIPYPTNVQLSQGILAADSYGPNRGVLPAGGGLRTYHGRRGDLIKDCTDPASCHLKSNLPNGPIFPSVPPYGLSRIPDGQSVGVDMQPIFSRPPPKPLNETAGPEPDWLHNLRDVSGYTGP